MQKIIGVGCDLIETKRIQDAVEKNKKTFIAKILTDSEIAYCMKYKTPYPQIAARFAAKEAVSKSLGCGIGKDLNWHDIEIYHDSKKKPHVSLLNNAAKLFKDVKFEISLSHTEDMAIAFVVAYR